MIPEWDVKIIQEVDLSKPYMACEEVLTCETGLVCNHDYFDNRYLRFEEMENVLPFERSAIETIFQNCHSKEELEKRFSDFEEEHYDDLPEILPCFELGIASITIAVAAMKGAPMSSCRGHLNGPRTGNPIVAFYAFPRIAPIFVKYARRFNCGIGNIGIERDLDAGLLLWARSVMPLLNMAQALYDDFHEREGYLYELSQE